LNCKKCNSELAELKTPGGNMLYFCEKKYCALYGKYVEKNEKN